MLRRDYSAAPQWVVLFIAAGLAASCSAIVGADGHSLPPPPGTDGGRVDSGMQDTGVPPTDGMVTTDAGDVCAGGCDDGVRCTLDSCGATGCMNAPTDGACSPTERCSVLMGCVPRLCENDASCDDGLYCNGMERCDVGGPGADPATGCAHGTPIRCFDDYTCTVDSCDEASNACVYAPSDAACNDGVACTADVCDPGAATSASGCVVSPDDSLCAGACASVGGGPGVRPGLCSPGAGGCTVGTAVSCGDGDPCTADSCDAGACAAAPLDVDGDGFPAQTAGGVACGGTDCDDANGGVHPGVPEVCNGRDDNCDGTVDEGCPVGPPDTCATAIALTPTGGGMLGASGTFSDFNDDYVSTCSDTMSGRGGRDAVYFFDITGLSDIVITTEGGAQDTVLAFGTECSLTGFARGCDDDISSSDVASRLFVHRLGPAPGSPRLRVYVLVDAFGPDPVGDFSVSVAISPAAADSCTGPIDISGGGTLVGEIGFAIGPGGPHGSCQPMTDWADPEGVATFAGSADGTEAFVANSRAFNPALYVRTSCGGAGSETACTVGTGSGTGGGRATLNANITSGADAFLFIDNGSIGGRYSVDYTP